MLFPVYLLREVVGEIIWERVGLYWEYRAKLSVEFDGFVRLYLHRAEGTVSLGLFREGSLQGRISVRSAQLLEDAFAFSLLREGFLPSEKLWEKPPLPFGARKCGDGWEYCIPLEELNDDVLDSFCFFRPVSIYGRSCVLLTQDREKRPCLPPLSP